jgi:hypothetical protein
MTRTIRHVIVALVLTLSGWNAHVQAKEPVDLLLVLAADVSRSVDADKFKLQREGYAAAFGDDDSTSISGGIDFALTQFGRAPFDAERRTIDVSGDGNNNNGRDVRLARAVAVAAGVTVNGLVLLTDERFSLNREHTNPPGGLEKYYRDNVIGGPNAFVLVAKDFNSFGNLLIKKLIAEIALVAPRAEILRR